jgi:hypothetical protein
MGLGQFANRWVNPPEPQTSDQELLTLLQDCQVKYCHFFRPHPDRIGRKRLELPGMTKKIETSERILEITAIWYSRLDRLYYAKYLRSVSDFAFAET